MDRETVKDIMDRKFGVRAVSVEDEYVWVSPVNQDSRRVAREISQTLSEEHNIPCPEVETEKIGARFRYGE